jgi:hypothetical protein
MHIADHRRERDIKRPGSNEESQTLGGRGLPQLVQSIPQIARSL